MPQFVYILVPLGSVPDTRARFIVRNLFPLSRNPEKPLMHPYRCRVPDIDVIYNYRWTVERHTLQGVSNGTPTP